MQKIYIFGAHSRAQTLAVYLESLYPEMRVEAFLYDNEERNPEKIGEVPVFFVDCLADEHRELNTEYPVYIGTRGIYHDRITEMLSKMGFEEMIPVTPELDRRLRNNYLKKYFASVGREFLKIDILEESAGFCHKKNMLEEAADFCYKKDMPEEAACFRHKRDVLEEAAGFRRKKDIPEEPAGFRDKKEGHTVGRIYVVQSALDKPLEQEYKLADYERVIQAGAELTKERLYPGVLTDDAGENISAKNRQYCELTAMYWIWKHAGEDIVGLAHYRRHFLLPENWVQIMEDYGIDVILPTPLYVAPSVAGNYKNRHDASEWEFLMCYLKEHSPEDYQEAVAFFEGNLYSPCNMFIMRRHVLDEFCEWLFPILEAVEAYAGQKGDGYQNRYPGFLSERLMSFYFEKNQDNYKMVYADKNFYM